jgi:hypothetical protein
MPARQLALTGPAAASLIGLDGFRDIDWPLLWCAPIASRSRANIIRTRQWQPPVLVGDVPVAPTALILRHLNLIDLSSYGGSVKVSPRDRVELALEHALRNGDVSPADFSFMGGRHTLHG